MAAAIRGTYHRLIAHDERDGEYRPSRRAAGGCHLTDLAQKGGVQFITRPRRFVPL